MMSDVPSRSRRLAPRVPRDRDGVSSRARRHGASTEARRRVDGCQCAHGARRKEARTGVWQFDPNAGDAFRACARRAPPRATCRTGEMFSRRDHGFARGEDCAITARAVHQLQGVHAPINGR